MIELKLEYEPVLRAWRRAAAELGDTRSLMRGVAGIMFRAVEDNFAEEGRPKWVDLHPGTKAAREKAGTWPGKILQRSGQLAASIVQLFTATTATVGSNKIYAPIVFLGGRTKPHTITARNGRALAFAGIVVRSVRHPGSNIPARNALRLTPRDLRDIVEDARMRTWQVLARRGLHSQSQA